MMTYAPELVEAIQKMADEVEQINKKTEPEKINEVFLWLDFYRVLLRNNNCVSRAAEEADKAMAEFRKRYPAD
jgi:hypothetical protein